MRIALVAEDYYPQLGGVPDHVHHLALELRRRGHEATIITARMGEHDGDPDYVRRVGRSLVIYANGGVARVTLGWNLRDEIAGILRDVRADLVHVHGGLHPVLGLLAPRVAWSLDLPVVATFHSWFPRSIGYTLFRSHLQSVLDRHAGTIAVSSQAAAAMSRYFRAQWEIIPNGVDVGCFRAPAPRQCFESGRPPRLLFLGRLEPRTRLETVLRAMPILATEYPGVELTVAGDGPWRARYERMARAINTPVRFLGQVREERPRLYAQADLYLCPTSRASFGVTLLESMSAGTPMVLSELPAFREVAGANAVFAPLDDPAAWARAAVGLLSNQTGWRTLSDGGRLIAESFAWPRVTDRVYSVYQRVTGQSPLLPVAA